MKIKSVILDTTAQTNRGLNPALWSYNQIPLIDWQITKILQAGRSPIVVIGSDGDSILRVSKKIDETELVFSTLETEQAGMIAGLHGTGLCSFYLPIHIPYPSEEVWSGLEREHFSLTYQHQIHILKPYFENVGYPWVVTKFGRDQFIKNNSILDLDLGVKDVPVLDRSIYKILNNTNDLE